MSAREAQPFNPRTVLGLVLFGALAFFAMLWFIASGQTDSGANNGEAHAASQGLTGYSALAAMLKAQGYDVRLSRNPGALEKEGLLVLTPPLWADGKEIAKIIAERRYVGPTLLILPKWYAMRAPRTTIGAKDGWVVLGGAAAPAWLKDMGNELKLTAELAPLTQGAADWTGLGAQGDLPDRREVQALGSGTLVNLVRDSKGRDLVSYLDDGGCYPVLDAAAGAPRPNYDDCDEDRWNLTIAAEPDLFDNYGMADRSRALLAARVVELTREKQDVPIVFDLTLNGLGRTQNLLTLAFTPPFLAATLCLIIAMLIVGWRAFRRFGPPLAEARAIAFGKQRLVANGAAFIQRTGRLHLLAEPYAALVGRRLAKLLGLRAADERAIDAALARRSAELPPFSRLAAALRTARGPSAILRAAHALRSLERTISR
jgi:hypothetical protein